MFREQKRLSQAAYILNTIYLEQIVGRSYAVESRFLFRSQIHQSDSLYVTSLARSINQINTK
jgi:hypothetical protein